MFEVESIGLSLKRSGYPKELQLFRPQLLGRPPVLLAVMRISPVVSFVRRAALSFGQSRHLVDHRPSGALSCRA